MLGGASGGLRVGLLDVQHLCGFTYAAAYKHFHGCAAGLHLLRLQAGNSALTSSRGPGLGLEPLGSV